MNTIYTGQEKYIDGEMVYMNKCNNCAKQYFCKIKDIKERLEPINCENFKSWIETNNYGEVKKI